MENLGKEYSWGHRSKPKNYHAKSIDIKKKKKYTFCISWFLLVKFQNTSGKSIEHGHLLLINTEGDKAGWGARHSPWVTLNCWQCLEKYSWLLVQLSPAAFSAPSTLCTLLQNHRANCFWAQGWICLCTCTHKLIIQGTILTWSSSCGKAVIQKFQGGPEEYVL